MYITQENWQALGQLLVPLWLILGGALGLAFSFLIAHGIIPSLAATRELPPVLGKLRVPFYVLCIAFLGLVIYAVLMFVDRLGVISDIFYRGLQ